MDSAGLRFPACLVLHEPTFAVPVGRSCHPGWAGLGWAWGGSAAPGKASWVQLSPSQLLAAGGTHSISSLLQFK